MESYGRQTSSLEDGTLNEMSNTDCLSSFPVPLTRYDAA